MGKNGGKIGGLYCLILIIICSVIIAKTEILSRIFLSDMKEALLPLTGDRLSGTEKLLMESFPSLFFVEEGPEDMDDYDGDFEEYVLDVAAGQTDVGTKPATLTDAELVADNPDNTDITETSAEPLAPGIVYSMDELANFDFLVSNCYLISDSTSISADELDASKLLAMDMTVDLSGEDYKVLIYHTHGSEAYADSRQGVTEDTVIGVGDELVRILEEKYGVKAYHDRNVHDKVNGVLDTNYAYDMSANSIDEILAQYPSIEVIIDIHRDGVREDLRLVKDMGGKPTAQLMFVNGISYLNKQGNLDYLYNPNIQTNLAFSMQLHLAGKELYGNLIRRNYISGYRYNMHKMPKAALVEVGAQTNTVQEAKNAMEPLAAVLYQVLSGN